MVAWPSGGGPKLRNRMARSDEHMVQRHTCAPQAEALCLNPNVSISLGCAPGRVLRIPVALPRLSSGTLSDSLRNSAATQNASPLQYSGEFFTRHAEVMGSVPGGEFSFFAGLFSIGFTLLPPLRSTIMVRQTETGEIMPVKGGVHTSLPTPSDLKAEARCSPRRRQYTSGLAQWLAYWAHSLHRSHALLFHSIAQDRSTKHDEYHTAARGLQKNTFCGARIPTKVKRPALYRLSWAGGATSGRHCNSTPRCTLMGSARAQRTLTSQCSASGPFTGTSKYEARRISSLPLLPRGWPQSQSGRFMGVISLGEYVFLHMLFLGK
jgi:hypothetical protein